MSYIPINIPPINFVSTPSYSPPSKIVPPTVVKIEEEKAIDYVGPDTLLPEKKLSSPPEFVDLNFPDNVKERATVIWHLAALNGKRGMNRRLCILYAFITAHDELGIAIAPQLVATELGLPITSVQRALSLCNPLTTGYTPRKAVTYNTAIDLIPSYAEKLSIPREFRARWPEISGVVTNVPHWAM